MSKRKRNKPISVLYEQLIEACRNSDHLHYHDEITAMQKSIRIFTHDKDISPQEWEKPFVEEFKGISFEMDGEEPVGIFSRPMSKISELSSDIKASDIDFITMKLDGSLVSSYVDGGYPSLKSEESLYSDVAVMASSLLNTDSYSSLREHIKSHEGFTYNFEYTSPRNCVVLNYDTPKLTLLSVRDNMTGEDVPMKQLFSDSVLRRYLVECLHIDSDKFHDLIKDVKNSERSEGIVITTNNNQRFKLKSDWYNIVHQLKEHVLDTKNLIYYVVESETDDLREIFRNQPDAINRIDVFERAFIDLLEFALRKVEVFYRDNHGLDINTYSANARMENYNYSNNSYLYPCFMSAYNGLDFDKTIEILKAYYIQNYQKLIPRDLLQ